MKFDKGQVTRTFKPSEGGSEEATVVTKVTSTIALTADTTGTNLERTVLITNVLQELAANKSSNCATLIFEEGLMKGLQVECEGNSENVYFSCGESANDAIFVVAKSGMQSKQFALYYWGDRFYLVDISHLSNTQIRLSKGERVLLRRGTVVGQGRGNGAKTFVVRSAKCAEPSREVIQEPGVVCVTWREPNEAGPECLKVEQDGVVREISRSEAESGAQLGSCIVRFEAAYGFYAEDDGSSETHVFAKTDDILNSGFGEKGDSEPIPLKEGMTITFLDMAVRVSSIAAV